MNIPFDVIAAKLAEHEIALSEMYAQFALTFPLDAELWTSLSRDETKHAMWIDEVRRSASGRAPQPAETTARPQGVEAATTYARGRAERCRSGQMTRLQAHALARDIENGMLERKMFATLASASPEFRKLQAQLTKETEAHRDKIIKAMAHFTPASS